jgi:hypothetical protein
MVGRNLVGFHLYFPDPFIKVLTKTVLNDRPPPTEEDPDIEERAANAIMEGELEDDDKRFGGK